MTSLFLCPACEAPMEIRLDGIDPFRYCTDCGYDCDFD